MPCELLVETRKWLTPMAQRNSARRARTHMRNSARRARTHMHPRTHRRHWARIVCGTSHRVIINNTITAVTIQKQCVCVCAVGGGEEEEGERVVPQPVLTTHRSPESERSYQLYRCSQDGLSGPARLDACLPYHTGNNAKLEEVLGALTLCPRG
jgi:hypothetical protein